MAERYLMNPMTGSVDLASVWEEEYEKAKAAGFPQESLWSEGDLDTLVEVVPNIDGTPEYNPNCDEWRPVE